jgi:hypothetical protein
MAEPIACNLAENAIDYLILAGEQAGDGSPRMLKHALATLADGVELLLKARLELKDWRLILSDLKKTDRKSYERGDFASVKFDEAVKRLKDQCAVELNDSDLLVVNELRQQRNRIRHFAIVVEHSVAVSLIVKTFSFAVEFVSVQLEPLRGPLEKQLSHLRALLGEFQAFIDARMAVIQPDLDSAYDVVQCPFCMQDALILGDGHTRCRFCGHSASGEEMAKQWADHFLGFQSMKDSLVDPRVERCPECYQQACVDMFFETDGSRRLVCLACGESGDYRPCTGCGELHESTNPGDQCDDCWADVLERNA